MWKKMKVWEKKSWSARLEINCNRLKRVFPKKAKIWGKSNYRTSSAGVGWQQQNWIFLSKVSTCFDEGKPTSQMKANQHHIYVWHNEANFLRCFMLMMNRCKSIDMKKKINVNIHLRITFIPHPFHSKGACPVSVTGKGGVLYEFTICYGLSNIIITNGHQCHHHHFHLFHLLLTDKVVSDSIFFTFSWWSRCVADLVQMWSWLSC